MTHAVELGEALARLDDLLPRKAPVVARMLRPPASDADIGLLSEAFAPLVLPQQLVELFSWHDGMIASEPPFPWWPIMSCGGLTSVSEAIDLREQVQLDDPETWHSSWCPIAADRWFLAVVETAPEGSCAVIEASSPDLPSPLAPSLAAMMHATCEVLEAGLPADMDTGTDQGLYDARAAILDEVYGAYKWPIGDDL